MCQPDWLYNMHRDRFVFAVVCSICRSEDGTSITADHCTRPKGSLSRASQNFLRPHSNFEDFEGSFLHSRVERMTKPFSPPLGQVEVRGSGGFAEMLELRRASNSQKVAISTFGAGAEWSELLQQMANVVQIRTTHQACKGECIYLLVSHHNILRFLSLMVKCSYELRWIEMTIS